MNNKTKGAVAGVAGLALLAGGTTFALWEDSETEQAGDITSGNLDLDTVGKWEYWDVSPDHADSTELAPVTGKPGFAIDDLETWRIVPGDEIQVTQGYALALDGDNLHASLVIGAGHDGKGDLVDDIHGVTLTYDVLDANAEAAPYDESTFLARDRPFGTPTELRLQAVGTREESGAADPDVVFVDRRSLSDNDGDADIQVVVKATFDYDTPDRERTEVVAALGEIGATLAQVRDGVESEGQ